MSEILKPFSKILTGCCSEVLETLADNSVDAIVTDPPYGLSFMGKKWDYDVPSVEIWRECLRVLKHGGHLLSFAGTRTQHRMAVNIEDAGFEIRDMIAWVYGSGFPKSLNIGKAVDKIQGNEREFVCKNPANRPYNLTKGETSTGWQSPPRPDKDKGSSPWEGFGTALKPALEPITLARKPLEKGLTVAENCLKWGTGGLNIDGCRVEYVGDTDSRTFGGKWKTDKAAKNVYEGGYEGTDQTVSSHGRFPANLIHDGSQEVLELFPNTKSVQSMRGLQHSGRHGGLADIGGNIKEGTNSLRGHNDSGSAARFFYCAKSSRSEREAGLDGMEEKIVGMSNGAQIHGEAYDKGQGIGLNVVKAMKNHHPTVKPIALMRYLCRLITPKNGIVLDPFMGSGSTGKAALMEGFRFIGIELEKEYAEIAERRISVEQPLFHGVCA